MSLLIDFFNGWQKQLQGIISGGGYLCGCSSCNFSNVRSPRLRFFWECACAFSDNLTVKCHVQVLSAYEFEQHAGVKTRHPNNHIFLENSRPIYSIIQELKTAPLSILDEVIKDIAGASVNEEYFRIWRGEANYLFLFTLFIFLFFFGDIVGLGQVSDPFNIFIFGGVGIDIPVFFVMYIHLVAYSGLCRTNSS